LVTLSVEPRRWKRTALLCLVCLVFPAVVIAMVMTYEQQGGYGESGPFPYSAVDYVFFADLGYTTLLICWMRGCRVFAAAFSIPLLALTAIMVFFAGMWFNGNYL
jgi:hypothetical protein